MWWWIRARLDISMSMFDRSCLMYLLILKSLRMWVSLFAIAHMRYLLTNIWNGFSFCNNFLNSRPMKLPTWKKKKVKNFIFNKKKIWRRKEDKRSRMFSFFFRVEWYFGILMKLFLGIFSFCELQIPKQECCSWNR